jgi:hypothetical protein
VRRSDKAKQVKKHEKTSMESMCLLQSNLDQSSAQQFTPCILPRDLPLVPQLCDEEDDEQSASVPSQLLQRSINDDGTPNVYTTYSSSKSNSAEFSLTLEAAYRNVFGYSE